MFATFSSPPGDDPVSRSTVAESPFDEEREEERQDIDITSELFVFLATLGGKPLQSMQEGPAASAPRGIHDAYEGRCMPLDAKFVPTNPSNISGATDKKTTILTQYFMLQKTSGKSHSIQSIDSLM